MVTVESFVKMAVSCGDIVELPHFDKLSFRTNNKIFATLDVDNRQACIKLSEVDQFAFSSTGADPEIYPVPNKWGKQGWTILNLDKIDENLCHDALNTAYDEVNKK
jgi:hypothetical protein